MFQQLLRDSISNRASSVRSGMLNFLLDWFSQAKSDCVIVKITQLIQVIGGHSISGKDIRKIFALLRSEKIGYQQKYCSLLLSTILSMLNEKGPTAFFDFSGNDSVSIYAVFNCNSITDTCSRDVVCSPMLTNVWKLPMCIELGCIPSECELKEIQVLPASLKCFWSV